MAVLGPATGQPDAGGPVPSFDGVVPHPGTEWGEEPGWTFGPTLRTLKRRVRAGPQGEGAALTRD